MGKTYRGREDDEDDTSSPPGLPLPELAPPPRSPRAGLWYLTRHACERWQERFEPHLDEHGVFARLAEISCGALRVCDDKANGGKVLYLYPDLPEARFVVAHDRVRDLPTLVTIVDARNDRRHSSALMSRPSLPFDRRPRRGR